MSDLAVGEIAAPRVSRALLWFDDTKGRNTAEKIMAGARRYKDNYGEPANVCLCNAYDIGRLQEIAVEGTIIHVRAAEHVRPNNFLVGRE